MEPLPDENESTTWHLAPQERFKFARISGDTNGIHFCKPYAKLFGFKRDFAQPIRVIAKCIDALQELDTTGPQYLNFFLKGPVYYGNDLTMKFVKNTNNVRFDLYSENNERPCITGRLRRL